MVSAAMTAQVFRKSRLRINVVLLEVKALTFDQPWRQVESPKAALPLFPARSHYLRCSDGRGQRQGKNSAAYLATWYLEEKC